MSGALAGWVRVGLFLGTVAPLIALQGVLTIDKWWQVGAALVAAGTLLLFAPLLLFPLATNFVQETSATLVETKAATPNLGAFLLAYLLPLLALSVTERTDVVLLFVLIILIGVLYTRGNLIHVQPIYWIMGWHVYESRQKSGEWCWILTRQTLRPGEHRLRDIGGHVLIDR